MDERHHTVVMDGKVYVQHLEGWMGIGPVDTIAVGLGIDDLDVAEKKIGKVQLTTDQAQWLRETVFDRDSEDDFQTRAAGFVGLAGYDVDHGTLDTSYQGDLENIPQLALDSDSDLIHDRTSLSGQQSEIVALLLMGHSRSGIAAWLDIDPKNVDSQRAKMREKLATARATEGMLGDILSRGAAGSE